MNKDKFNVIIPMNPFIGQGSRHIKNVKEIVDNFKLSLEGNNIVDILDKINLPNFNPDYKDENGDPILHLLINDRYLPEDNKLFILKYLINEKKADILIKNKKFQNILHLSLKHGLYKIVEYLLSYIDKLNFYDIDRNNYLNYLIDVTPLEDNELKFNNKDNYIDKKYDEEKEKIVIQLIEIYNNEYVKTNNQKVTNIKKIIEIINDNFIYVKKEDSKLAEDRIFFKDPLFYYSINLVQFYTYIIEFILKNIKLNILGNDKILDIKGSAIVNNTYNDYEQNIQNIIDNINKYIIDIPLNEIPDKNITYYDLLKHEYKIDYIKYDDHKNFDNINTYTKLIKDIVYKLKVKFYNNMLNGIKFGDENIYYDKNNNDIIQINNLVKKNNYVNHLYENYSKFVNTIINIKDVFHIDDNIKIYNKLDDYNKNKDKDNIFYNLIKLTVEITDYIKLEDHNKKILENYKIYFNINDSKLIINNYTNYLIIKFLEYINTKNNYYKDYIDNTGNNKNNLDDKDYDINKKISELNDLIKIMFDKDGIVDLINKRSDKNITSYDDIKKKILDDINNCTNNILYSSNYLKKNDIVIIKNIDKEFDNIMKIIDKNININNNFINSILNHNKYNYNIIKYLFFDSKLKFNKQEDEIIKKINSKIYVKKKQLDDIKNIYKNNFTKNKYVEEAIKQIDIYNIIKQLNNYFDIKKNCIYELYIFEQLYDIINLTNNKVLTTYLAKENKIKKDNDNLYKECKLDKLDKLENYDKYRLIKRKGYEDYNNFKMDNIELFNNDGDVKLFNSFFDNTNDEYNDVISNVKILYDKYIDDVIDIFSDLYEINMNLLISIENDKDLIIYLSK